jgi:acyl carrier protein
MEQSISYSDLGLLVSDVIVKTFNLPGEHLGRELRMGSVPGWDSLGHMRLVVALEEKFDVNFPAFLLPEILDVDSIVREIFKLKSELRGDTIK